MGKTRKSKWGHLPTVANDKIDMSNPEKDIALAQTKAKSYVKQHAAKLYTVTTAKVVSTNAARILKAEKKSEVEERKVNKMAKQLEKLKPTEVKITATAKGVKITEPSFDVWDAPNIAFKKKPTLEPYQLITNKAVVLPESGYSYNPNLKSYEATIEKVVKDNVKEYDPKSVELVVKRNKRKIEKRRQAVNKIRANNTTTLNSNQKQILKQRDEQIKQKKLDNLVENYEKELDKKIRELTNNQKKVERHNNNLEKKKEDILTGKIRTYDLKLSKHKLPAYVPPSLALPEEMPENFRKVKTDGSANIRDQFESIYRRGLIEYKKIGKVQRRAKVKYHNKHSVKEAFYMDPNN